MAAASSHCETLNVQPGEGTRVRVFGGYDFEPAWLGDRSDVSGRFLKWIPGQNTPDACVVVLDDELTAEGLVGGTRRTVSGRYLVLEPRKIAENWASTGTVHVELLGEEPPSVGWGMREMGAWVESHATYEVESH